MYDIETVNEVPFFVHPSEIQGVYVCMYVGQWWESLVLKYS